MDLSFLETFGITQVHKSAKLYNIVLVFFGYLNPKILHSVHLRGIMRRLWTLEPINEPTCLTASMWAVTLTGHASTQNQNRNPALIDIEPLLPDTINSIKLTGIQNSQTLYLFTFIYIPSYCCRGIFVVSRVSCSQWHVHACNSTSSQPQLAYRLRTAV